jgi:hypothetical protein
MVGMRLRVILARTLVPGMLLAPVAGCSSGSPGSSAGAPCEQGTWVSSGMVAPAQAGIVDAKPSGGGDGANISFLADGTFQIDFGPMHPATASFTSNGQPAVLTVQFSGVGKGVWTADGNPVTASVADLNTAHATATITLGTTVPPIFDASWQQIDAEMMLGNAHVGVFTVTSCDRHTLAMTMPFPGGTVAVTAARKG